MKKEALTLLITFLVYGGVVWVDAEGSEVGELFVPVSEGGIYDDSLQIKLKRFNEWFWDMSDVNKKVSIRASQWGNGVFLRDSIVGSDTPRKQIIKLGEAIMELKEEFTLCDASLKTRTLVSSAATYGPKLLHSGVSEQDRVALALLAEFLLGSNSRIQPWMDILPGISEITPPHVWAPELQDLIEPFTLRDEVRQRAKTLTNEYQALASHSSRVLQELEAFVSEHASEEHLEAVVAKQAAEIAAIDSSSTVTTKSSKLRFFTKERVLWARSLIDTRAWNMNGKKWLNPAADMFNHHPDHEDEIYDYKQTMSLGQRSHKFLKFHKVEPKSGSKAVFAKAFSDRSVYNRPRKNESREEDGASHMQVYESYGDNTNDIYFLYHGFVPQENKNDCQKIELKLRDGFKDGFEPLTRAHSELLRTVPALQPSICIHLDEVPPALLLVGLVSQLKTKQMEDKCVLDALKLAQSGKSLHFAMKSRYTGLKRCLEASSENGMLAIATGLRYSKSIIRGQFKALFTTSDTQIDEKVIALPSSESQRVVALTLRIQRKKILKALLGEISKYLLKYQKKVEQMQQRSDDL